jgi:hypothetical protein
VCSSVEAETEREKNVGVHRRTISQPRSSHASEEEQRQEGRPEHCHSDGTPAAKRATRERDPEPHPRLRHPEEEDCHESTVVEVVQQQRLEEQARRLLEQRHVQRRRGLSDSASHQGPPQSRSVVVVARREDVGDRVGCGGVTASGLDVEGIHRRSILGSETSLWGRRCVWLLGAC